MSGLPLVSHTHRYGLCVRVYDLCVSTYLCILVRSLVCVFVCLFVCLHPSQRRHKHKSANGLPSGRCPDIVNPATLLPVALGHRMSRYRPALLFLFLLPPMCIFCGAALSHRPPFPVFREPLLGWGIRYAKDCMGYTGKSLPKELVRRVWLGERLLDRFTQAAWKTRGGLV